MIKEWVVFLLFIVIALIHVGIVHLIVFYIAPFVQRVRTTLVQTIPFTTIGPALWSALPILSASILSGYVPSSSSLLKTCLFSDTLCLGALLNDSS